MRVPAMLTILHRDDHLIAIDKPAGLLVHRSDIDRRETRFAVQLLRDQIGRHVFPAHRLDRGTSGVLLFGLDADTTAELGRRFAAGEVAKTYLAAVRGWPVESGTIDHALSRADESGRGITPGPPQEAVTDFRRLATIELPFAVERYPMARYALMALSPRTGRKHQLRRHMKHIAHPIIGDASHGKGVHNRFFAERFGCDRLLLASTALSFPHPADGRAITLRAAPGDRFAALLRRFEWEAAAALAAGAPSGARGTEAGDD
jgi:tRNA pseudouridine65 synthase